MLRGSNRIYVNDDFDAPKLLIGRNGVDTLPDSLFDRHQVALSTRGLYEDAHEKLIADLCHHRLARTHDLSFWEGFANESGQPLRRVAAKLLVSVTHDNFDQPCERRVVVLTAVVDLVFKK